MKGRRVGVGKSGGGANLVEAELSAWRRSGGDDRARSCSDELVGAPFTIFRFTPSIFQSGDHKFRRRSGGVDLMGNEDQLLLT